ncbi:zinc-binding alcohol dehydrogenase family protein, partial [uncultured Hymenobacter sp.]|uniref:zinc-binding alcohol dehydrogenase family protein n=1 Tax=uncultured Hymenobacter sp. TaxID=170016 RepID=UPI0035CA451B
MCCWVALQYALTAAEQPIAHPTSLLSQPEPMNPQPTNTAAWLVANRAHLEVNTASYTAPQANELVIKNYAVAINPLDWIMQGAGSFLFSWMKLPFVLGSDLAGEVVEVGAGVTRFQVGDRVLAHAVGADKKRNSPAESAFQQYTVVLAHMAAPIPDSLAYESATVLPLALSTAACGLFQKDQLALNYPSAAATPTGKTILVWGGTTSVGSNAIQLAVAAGYEVIATASPRNFAYVQQLGASQVFDYNSPTVVQDVIKAFQGKTSAGALAIGGTSALACADIVHGCKGSKFVSMTTFPVDFQRLTQGPGRVGLQFLRQLPRLISFSVSLFLKSRLRGIRTNSIFGTTLMDNEVSRVIYTDFLPQALAEGRYVAAPAPHVIGQGLASI